MQQYVIDLIDDFTDIDPETRLNEADFQWASTEQGERFRFCELRARRRSRARHD
jgi:hypothetical protein